MDIAEKRRKKNNQRKVYENVYLMKTKHNARKRVPYRYTKTCTLRGV